MTNEGIHDPYQVPNDGMATEAKVFTPKARQPMSRVVTAALVIGVVAVGVAILSTIVSATSKSPASAGTIAKPVTMSKGQGDSFASEQAQKATFLKAQDEDEKKRKAEDTVLGEAKELAADPLEEAPGAPSRTKKQDEAIRNPQPPKQKTEAEIQRERALMEAQHRRQNDIDSSPMSLDFSDYFDRQQKPASPTVAQAASQPDVDPQAAAEEARAAMVREQHRAGLAQITGAMRKPQASDSEAQEEPEVHSRNSAIKEAHDPTDDYVFDSSYGKLYRLIEDSILETVLVNRLAGAAAGPVIVMVTTDVYSHSGAHLLIPKGTRLLGQVSAVASTNQERLFVAFHRMVMPDGYSVSLDKFKGLDVVGQTGLRDLVNHHYMQIFGASLALAAIGATANAGASASNGSYDWGVSMRTGVSQQLGQSAQRIMERFLNVLPTFTIRERALVKVMLSGDLLLPDVKNHTMDPDL
jgi:type IV secretion system protein VirB10